MTEREPAKSATSDGLTVSPSLDLVAEAAQVPPQYSLIDRRVLLICVLAILLGVAAAFVAQVLLALIAVITNLAYFGELSLEVRAPPPLFPAWGCGRSPSPSWARSWSV